MQLHKQNPKQGFDGLALQASERARARSLLEILAESGGEITSGIDPKLLQEKKEIQQQLSALEQLRVRLLSSEHTEEQRKTINIEIDDLLQKYRSLLTEIRATSSNYAALTQPQPLTLSEIQQQILDSEYSFIRIFSRRKSQLFMGSDAHFILKVMNYPDEKKLKVKLPHFEILFYFQLNEFAEHLQKILDKN